jgi:hypothetical protein
VLGLLGEARLQEALERQNFLVAELDHRVKKHARPGSTVVMLALKLFLANNN